MAIKRHQRNHTNQKNQRSRQQISYLGMFPFKIPAEIENDTGEEVNDQREADSKK
jgi:hypothetical protein